MKKCKKCEYENISSATVCENCYSPLEDEISSETSEAFFKKLDRKEKIINFINYSLLVLYFIIVVPLYVISVKEIGHLGVGIFLFIFLLFMPIAFYLSLFHPDILFEISYTHMISNISDAQPSDWFYTTTKWSGYLFLGLGVFVILKLYFGLI